MCMCLCAGVHMREGYMHMCTQVRGGQNSVRCLSQSLPILSFEAGSFAECGMEFCNKQAPGVFRSLFSSPGVADMCHYLDFTQALGILTWDLMLVW